MKKFDGVARFTIIRIVDDLDLSLVPRVLRFDCLQFVISYFCEICIWKGRRQQ